MRVKKVAILLFLFLSAFDKMDDRIRLIFEESKTMRSSFCLYSDGKFYETRPSGCVGQEFFWGYWEKIDDTTKLFYQTNKIFDFQVFKSIDTANRYQIIKIVDCYNQPVRFQNVYFDTIYQNLFNPGILRIEKGKNIFYDNPRFDNDAIANDWILSNSDTIIYKWKCNREAIESIDGGTLFINQELKTKKAILRNKKVLLLPG